MRPSARIVTPLVRYALSTVCRIDSRAIRNIPKSGPLIVAINHVNFLEVPLIYSALYPRDARGIVKAETWNNLFMRFLARTWDAIPIQREATDLAAMRIALELLSRKKILIIAPEGTRSTNGKLQKGHGGIVQLALRSGAPVIPVAHTGGHRFWKNLKSMRRTSFSFSVGRPFYLKIPEGYASLTRQLREEMTDALMAQLALLLPPWQRGAYSMAESIPGRTLRFMDASKR